MPELEAISINSLAITFRAGDLRKRSFVFVHGNTQNDTCGKAIMDYFANRGHSVLSYDLPGHGNSVLTTTNYRFDDLIMINHQILKTYDLSAPILCGHSLGGMIQAGTIARYRIKRSSLILCGSYDANPIYAARSLASGIADNIANTVDKALTEYIDKGFKVFERQKKYDYFSNLLLTQEQIELISLRFTHPQANQINLSTLGDFDVRNILIKLAIPTLVLHGEDETVIPITLINWMSEQYSHMHVCRYPQGDHYAFYRQALLTNDFLDRFYDNICI